jgi:predicted DNA-binding protein
MGDQLLIRIDPGLKERVAKVARREGRTASDVVRELLENYVRERDVGAYVDDLWSRIGTDLRSKKATAKDVPGAIRASRRKAAANAGRS